MNKNIIVLFNGKLEYGHNLKEYIKKFVKDKEIYHIDGKVKLENRFDIVKRLEKQDNIILIANFPTFSTGINVKNIHNIILWSPLKSENSIIQSIGRGIRKFKNKCANIYDFCDVLYQDVNLISYSSKHAMIRLNYYKERKFEIIKKKIEIN